MRSSVAESRPRATGLGRFGSPVLALFCLLAISGCTGPYSIVDPASGGARAVAAVWWAMATVALVVTAGVVAAWWLGSRRPAANLPAAAAQRQAKRVMIWGGLVLPTVAIVALLIFGLPAGQRLGSATPEAGWQVNVTARQWVWEIHYPDLPGADARNEIHVPAGVPVDFHVASRDVIHGFWIPRLGGKIDAIPGRTNVWRLQADAPGTYHGLCAEYCGDGHANMQFTVIALDPDAFRAWQANAGASLPGDSQ